MYDIRDVSRGPIVSHLKDYFFNQSSAGGLKLWPRVATEITGTLTILLEGVFFFFFGGGLRFFPGGPQPPPPSGDVPGYLGVNGTGHYGHRYWVLRKCDRLITGRCKMTLWLC